ncbi:MAG: glutamine synthetase beta-grasp domain-containing protein, partial [Vicinamibacteria bacterium]
MTPSDVLKLAKQKGALIVDLRFIDMPGLWQHFSIPVSELTEELFAEGIGFDGSSIRGFQAINESDMLLFPDPDTAQMDPFTAVPTLVMICDVKDPITGAAYARDPRYIARKAEAYVKSTGLADTTYIGPELEFFIFDDVRFDQGQNFGYYHVNAESGHWNSGRVGTPENPNLGYRARSKQGYFPVAPSDHHQDLRSEMVLNLESVGVKIEVHHHEVASAGQTEIDMRFDT